MKNSNISIQSSTKKIHKIFIKNSSLYRYRVDNFLNLAKFLFHLCSFYDFPWLLPILWFYLDYLFFFPLNQYKISYLPHFIYEISCMIFFIFLFFTTQKNYLKNIKIFPRLYLLCKTITKQQHETNTIHKYTTLHLFFFFYPPFLILSFVKHQYHSKIDDQIDKALASMTQGLINKLVSVLEGVLGKLARYDEGSLIGSLLSFTVRFN